MFVQLVASIAISNLSFTVLLVSRMIRICDRAEGRVKTGNTFVTSTRIQLPRPRNLRTALSHFNQLKTPHCLQKSTSNHLNP
uniref:AlNc14C358G10968 protein n=1 Tax=Albugo laibachii Nc14 TaxID=890382 RepID=F0WXL7_9STRA|nr:AlNc14C358G10968 [Albugo laibachii Nc14]|eukprot:CCA26211.1 AlNc14C358G10968 [Albugo laibachii Nc14]